MIPPFCIDDVLRSLTSTLSLSWQNKNKNPHTDSIEPAGFHNWAGLLHPDRHHVIEILGNQNLNLLNEWLLENKPATTWLVCDNADIPDLLAHHANRQRITIIKSPLPAARLVDVLSFHLSQHYCINKYEHGVFIKVFDLGILLKGKSGIGKSSLALELVERQHQLVADDTPLFYQFPGTTYIYGLCPPLSQEFLHVHDLGVLNVNKLFGNTATTCISPLHLVIELCDDESVMQLQPLSAIHNHTNILGVQIPVIKLFAKPQRNMAVLVETAVKNHILYRDGYDAGQALASKLEQKLKDTTK
jgi:HPr kinase/phosphorylase